MKLTHANVEQFGDFFETTLKLYLKGELTHDDVIERVEGILA